MIEIRECRVSADWKFPKNGGPGKPTTMLTYYRVVVDGLVVDSFMTRQRAEAKAVALRERVNG